MKKGLKIIIAVALLICMAAALIYTRPLTLAQRYPILDLSQCTQIRGYFFDGRDIEQTPFVIYHDDPHFGEMIRLFQTVGFKTRIRNLFPQGTKTHLYQEGDFKWEVMFRFENVLFSNGDMGSGDMLQIKNFFGDLAISFDGEQVQCTINSQETWARKVMEIILQYAAG